MYMHECIYVYASRERERERCSFKPNVFAKELIWDKWCLLWDRKHITRTSLGGRMLTMGLKVCKQHLLLEVWSPSQSG